MSRRILASLLSFLLFCGAAGFFAPNARALIPSAPGVSAAPYLKNDAARPVCTVVHTLPAAAVYSPKAAASVSSKKSADYTFAYYSTLTTPEKQVYTLLVEAAIDRAAGRLIPLKGIDVDNDGIETAYTAFYNDYPQFFWIAQRYLIANYTQDDVSSNYIVFYSMYNDAQGYIDNARINLLQEEVHKVAGVFLAAAQKHPDEYGKELALHDMLVSTTVYDTSSKMPDTDYSIVGPLLYHKARSGGYSRAFQYLLNHAGIECTMVYGILGTFGHDWNVVQIDGRYYQTDPAWDDPVGVYETVSHQYFNLTGAQMLADRTIATGSDYGVPVCDSSAASYYVRTGSRFASLADFKKRIVPLLVSDIQSGNFDIEVTAKDAAAYRSIVGYLSAGKTAKAHFDEIVDSAGSALSGGGRQICYSGYSENKALSVFTFHFMEGTASLDKTALAQKIAYAEANFGSGSLFTEDSYGYFEDALQDAESAVSDADAEQSDIDDSVESLQDGIDSLAVKREIFVY